MVATDNTTTRRADMPVSGEAPAAGLCTIEVVPLATLRPHPRNYREHPDDEIEHLMQSIVANGVYRNIVVARDGTILAGHGVVLACRRLTLQQVPVVRLDLDPSEPRALKVLAGDNEIAHLAQVDDRALSEMLREIRESDIEGLLGTGYDEMMLANLVMVTRPTSEIRSFDEAAEWAGMPEYSPTPESPSIIVRFRTEEDRVEMLKRLDLPTSETKSVWWPLKAQDDVSSIRIEA